MSEIGVHQNKEHERVKEKSDSPQYDDFGRLNANDSFTRFVMILANEECRIWPCLVIALKSEKTRKEEQ